MNQIGALAYGGGIEQACSEERLIRKRETTYIERVDYALQDAEQRLADLKRMKEIFAQNPEFQELLTLVQRGHV